ncbi:MAG: hypothetical protein AB7Q69_09280 [Gemmatimonadales bacterium]
MLIFVAFHLYGAVLSLLAPVRDCFSLYHVLAATSTAAVAMIAYLLKEYRGVSSAAARHP